MVKDLEKVVRKSKVEELIEKEKMEKEAELERLKLERMVEEERKKVEELRKGRGEEEKPLSLEEFGLSINTLRELAKLPEEERMNIIQTWMMLRSADKSQAGILLPILIGFAKANPSAGRDSLVEFAKAVSEQIKTGAELAKASRPEPTYDPIKLVETMTTLVAQQIQKPLEELVERLEPQPSPFERILMDDRLFQRAREIGLFSPRREETPTTPPEIQLEVEKIRMERDKWLEELRTEREKWLAEFKAKTLMEERRFEAEEKKWEALKELMSGPLGQVVQRMGDAAASKISGGKVAEPPKPIMITCPQCGHTFWGSSDMERAICPRCGTVLQRAASIQGGGGAGREQQSQEPEQRMEPSGEPEK